MRMKDLVTGILRFSLPPGFNNPYNMLLLAAQMYPNASMMYLVQSFFMFSRLIFIYQHMQKPNGACVLGKLRQGFLELFVQLMEPISPFHDLVVMGKHFIIGRIFTVSAYKVN